MNQVDEMTRMSASAARKEFAETLNRVAYTGDRVILERKGKGVAAIVTLEDLALIQSIEDRMDLEAARAAMQEPGHPWEEVKRLLRGSD